MFHSVEIFEADPMGNVCGSVALESEHEIRSLRFTVTRH